MGPGARPAPRAIEMLPARAPARAVRIHAIMQYRYYSECPTCPMMYKLNLLNLVIYKAFLGRSHSLSLP